MLTNRLYKHLQSDGIYSDFLIDVKILEVYETSLMYYKLTLFFT